MIAGSEERELVLLKAFMLSKWSSQESKLLERSRSTQGNVNLALTVQYGTVFVGMDRNATPSAKVLMCSSSHRIRALSKSGNLHFVHREPLLGHGIFILIHPPITTHSRHLRSLTESTYRTYPQGEGPVPATTPKLAHPLVRNSSPKLGLVRENLINNIPDDTTTTYHLPQVNPYLPYSPSSSLTAKQHE